VKAPTPYAEASLARICLNCSARMPPERGGPGISAGWSSDACIVMDEAALSEIRSGVAPSGRVASHRTFSRLRVCVCLGPLAHVTDRPSSEDAAKESGESTDEMKVVVRCGVVCAACYTTACDRARQCCLDFDGAELDHLVSGQSTDQCLVCLWTT
jgi:hypothetical protein